MIPMSALYNLFTLLSFLTDTKTAKNFN